MKIYVGNLANSTSEPELRQSFEKFGEVTRVNIVLDKIDGKPKGFGFVEMPTLEQANAAILGLNGKDLGGQALTINEARSNPTKTDAATGQKQHQSTGGPVGNLPEGKK